MATAAAPPTLEGLRLFVVEDELLVAMLLEAMLGDLGCVVIDVAGTLDQALARLERMSGGADAAILDVNLAGEPVFPVADALAARNIPFLFATGYGRRGVSARYPNATVLDKPYGLEDLAAALTAIAPSPP